MFNTILQITELNNIDIIIITKSIFTLINLVSILFRNIIKK